MSWQPEVPAHRLHCISLTRLCGRANMFPQPVGETCTPTLPCDPHICGREPCTGSTGLPTEHQVDTCTLAGDVLRYLHQSSSDWAGVGRRIITILAQCTVCPPSTLEEPWRFCCPQSSQLQLRYLGSKHYLTNVFGAGVGQQKED